MIENLPNTDALLKAVQQAQGFAGSYAQISAELSRFTTAIARQNTSPIVAAAESLLRRESEWVRLVNPFSDLMKHTERHIQSLTAGSAISAMIDREFSAWEKIMRPPANQFSEITQILSSVQTASLTWSTMLEHHVQRFQAVGLLAGRLALVERLLEPSRIYTQFIGATIERLGNAASSQAASALEFSVKLAEAQFLTGADSLNRVITLPTDNDPISPVRPLAAPYVQQDELLEAAETGDFDFESLDQCPPAAQTTDLVREILVLVAQCNDAVKLRGQHEFFKPTTRLLEAFADLPWMLPTDKARFGDFVDCLNFIFYEGAGKDNLRFLKRHGGVLDDAECNFIWCVKHLRNKWVRHDADHGKDSDIRKSWADLRDKCVWLGLPCFPSQSEHFRRLHRRLLEESKRFLETIIQRLPIT